MYGGAGNPGTTGTDQSCIRHSNSTESSRPGFTALLVQCPLIRKYPEERTHWLSVGARGPHPHSFNVIQN